MELDGFDGQLAMPDAHDYTVFRFGGDFEAVGQGVAFDNEGMVAGGGERIGRLLARWQTAAHAVVRRLSVRPGLTCIWQVSGRNQISFEDWMYLDMQYIDHWSLSEDLSLILQTFPVVLTGRGAS